MKPKIAAGIGVLLLIALLIPIPNRLKDGGTVSYHAALYHVERVHRLNPDQNSGPEYLEGTVIKILGFEVFNNVK